MNYFELIDIAKIAPLESNPRKNFDARSLDELCSSIKEHGIIQPLVVRHSALVEGSYELVAGERRWRCARKLELVQLPCMIRNLDDLEVAEIQLIENIDRHNLDPLEESSGVCRLVELGVHPSDLAERLGRAEDWVQLRLDLPELPDMAKDALTDGVLGLGGARQLLRVDRGMREEATQRLLEIESPLTERTVSEVLRNRYHEPRRRRELWKSLRQPMLVKFAGNATPIDDVEKSYQYVRAWGAGIGHFFNVDDEVGGLSRHPAESVVSWGDLALQHDVPTLLVCAGGVISIDNVVEVVDRRIIIDAERALRDQGKSHTLGPRKTVVKDELDDVGVVDGDAEQDYDETADQFVVRHVMSALELRHDDVELAELLMPVLELMAERGVGE